MNFTSIQASPYKNFCQSAHTPDKEVIFKGVGNAALQKLHSVNINEYEQLSSLDKILLRTRVRCEKLNLKKICKSIFCCKSKKISHRNYNCFAESIPVNIRAANILKLGLDRKYGEGNYVLVTIGRSMSTIAKSMTYLIGDENVRQVPLSYARRFNGKNPFKLESRRGLKIFLKHLEFIGLTPEKVVTSNKTYVFLDYCLTGNSLHGAENLFRSKKVLGVCGNMEFIDVKDIMEPIDSAFTKEMVNIYFDGEYFKDYALVAGCDKLKHTIRAANHDLPDKVKLFFFSILDKMKRGKESL